MAHLGVVGRRLALLGVDPKLKVVLVLVRADGSHLAVGEAAVALVRAGVELLEVVHVLVVLLRHARLDGMEGLVRRDGRGGAVFFWEIMSLYWCTSSVYFPKTISNLLCP